MGDDKPGNRTTVGLFIGDLHVGSHFGLMPKGFVLSNGEEVVLNRGQEYLLECWKDMLATIPRRLDFLFVNGDSIDCDKPNELGVGLCEPDLSYQVMAAYELLEPLAKRAKHVFFTAGTPYHVGSWAWRENMLAQQLGAERGEMGRFAPLWWHVVVNGVHLDVAHHQSRMIRYPATALAREAEFAALVADLMEAGKADVVVRSHVHRFIQVNVDGLLGIGVPAFCLQSGYAKHSKVPNRMLSRYIGGVLVKILPEGKAARRSSRIVVDEILYPHPKIAAKVVEV